MPKPTDTTTWSYRFSDDVTFSQKIVLFHPKNPELFAVLKRSRPSTNPRLWDLPGGNVLYGELHMDSLKKEILEETGITETLNLEPVFVSTRVLTDPDIYRLFIGYKGTSLSENITISKEHTEYKWVTLEEFSNLDAKETLKEVAKLAYKK